MKPSHRLALALLVVIVPVLLYAPLLTQHSYAWDDWLLFVNDPALRSLDSMLARAFEPVLWASSYVRPLVMASFGLELQIWGHDPRWPHYINLGFHALNTFLVYGLAGAFVADRPSNRSRVDVFRALLPALLYAVHPALVEPTSWLSGRFDLMVTTFMLLALTSLLRGQGWWRDLGFASCFGLALLCKEMAITLPLVAALLLVWRLPAGTGVVEAIRQLLGRPYRRLWVLTVLVVIAYFCLRWAVLGNLVGSPRTPNTGIPTANKVALVGWTIVFYLKGTWLPFFQASPVYPMDAHAFSLAALVQGGLIAGGGLLGAMALLARRPQHALALGLGIWCVALLPVLHLVPLPVNQNIGHDRFLTFPLALWALMFTRLGQSGAADTLRWGRIATLPLFAWILGATLMVRASVPIWANDLSLWAWAYEKSPKAPEVVNNYLVAANRYGEYEISERIAATQLDFLMPEFEINRAVFKVRRGDPKAALVILQELEAKLASPHANHAGSDDYLEAFQAPRKQTTIIPTLYDVLAETYFHLEDYRLTERMARISLRYHSEGPVGLIYQALGLYGLGRWAEADVAFERALSREPSVGFSTFRVQRDALLAKLCPVSAGSQGTGARCRPAPP